MERAGVDVCIDDPGYEPDLRIEADLASFAQVWLGDLSFDAALHAKRIWLDGPRRLTQSFPGWLMLSHFADVARPAAGPRALSAAHGQEAPVTPASLPP